VSVEVFWPGVSFIWKVILLFKFWPQSGTCLQPRSPINSDCPELMTKTPVDPSLRAAGLESKAWPFEEARKLLKRVEQKKTRHDYILFETGYGPPACRTSAPSARWRAPP
jgi:hypothetical protein